MPCDAQSVAAWSPSSGLSTLIKDHLAGGASRLAALLLPQILPVFSVVAPCHPGAALRDLVLVQRGQATSIPTKDTKGTKVRHTRKRTLGVLCVVAFRVFVFSCVSWFGADLLAQTTCDASLLPARPVRGRHVGPSS